jgi:hypothetical protein
MDGQKCLKRQKMDVTDGGVSDDGMDRQKSAERQPERGAHLAPMQVAAGIAGLGRRMGAGQQTDGQTDRQRREMPLWHKGAKGVSRLAIGLHADGNLSLSCDPMLAVRQAFGPSCSVVVSKVWRSLDKAELGTGKRGRRFNEPPKCTTRTRSPENREFEIPESTVLTRRCRIKCDTYRRIAKVWLRACGS